MVIEICMQGMLCFLAIFPRAASLPPPIVIAAAIVWIFDRPQAFLRFLNFVMNRVGI